MIKKQINIIKGLLKSGKEFVRRFGRFLEGQFDIEPLTTLPKRLFRRQSSLMIFQRNGGLIDTNIVVPKAVRSTVRKLEYVMTQDTIGRMKAKRAYSFFRKQVPELSVSLRRTVIKPSYRMVKSPVVGRRLHDIMPVRGVSIAVENLHKQTISKLSGIRWGFRPRVRKSWIGSIS